MEYALSFIALLLFSKERGAYSERAHQGGVAIREMLKLYTINPII